MAASSTTDHMWLFEKDDLHKLAELPSWVEQSINVFTGDFTCASDKDKLVDVVLALYACCIACGRYKPAKGTVTIEDDTESKALWLSALIDRNRKSIFPPEWFGDSIEILEAEIQNCLEAKK